MSGSHNGSGERGALNLSASEANLASICVAIVAGSIGGNICTLFMNILPFWGLLILITTLGFIIPWVVCKYFFKTAHAWYSGGSLQHRLYDGVGIISAFVGFYL